MQDWFPLGWTGWISLMSKGLSSIFSSITVQNISSSLVSFIYGPNLTFILTFVRKVMSLLFNMLSRLVTAFLTRSKHLLISWLQSPSAEVLEPKKMKSVTCLIVSPSICHGVMGTDTMILVFWMLSFKPAFSLPLYAGGNLKICVTCFTVIIALFRWSGTKPKISSRYACVIKAYYCCLRVVEAPWVEFTLLHWN